MKVIRITPEPEATPRYASTIADAKSWVKDNVTPKLRFAVRVAELEYPTDKTGILKMLNNVAQPVLLREWSVTPRGGFAEIEA